MSATLDVPVDVDAEMMLLGAAIQNRQAWEIFAARTADDDFYFPAHRRLSAAIRKLGPDYCLAYDDRLGVALPPRIIGDREELAACYRACFSPLLAPEWARRVRLAAGRRLVLTFAAQVYNAGADGDDLVALRDVLDAVLDEVETGVIRV